MGYSSMVGICLPCSNPEVNTEHQTNEKEIGEKRKKVPTRRPAGLPDHHHTHILAPPPMSTWPQEPMRWTQVHLLAFRAHPAAQVNTECLYGLTRESRVPLGVLRLRRENSTKGV